MERFERELHALTLRCYWDGSEKPAVEVPLGDFMCSIGENPFENELFANPEGRSYNCYIPMPFKTGAKVTLTNESGTDLTGLCYKIDFLIYDQPREDYIGSAWGQGKFTGRYQGCLVADAEAGKWSFYCFHICDPVYFEKDIKVTIQDIGGHSKKTVKGMQQAGLPVVPTSYYGADGKIIPLYKVEEPEGLDDGGWMNFYRSDDFATVAYFYLDRPFSELPEIQSIEERVDGLAGIEKTKTEEEVILVAT